MPRTCSGCNTVGPLRRFTLSRTDPPPPADLGRRSCFQECAVLGRRGASCFVLSAMPAPFPPPSPRLFLVDGYALIYRAFFALISRPLTTAAARTPRPRGASSTSSSDCSRSHQPEYLGWVHDSGPQLPPRAVSRLQGDAREARPRSCRPTSIAGWSASASCSRRYRIPILSLRGLRGGRRHRHAREQGVGRGVNVVIVSGDKDFQQLVQPGVWLLNPGRGGPASVEEQWVSVENGSRAARRRRRSTSPTISRWSATRPTTCPGVKGIGDKTARELVNAVRRLSSASSRNVDNITKKRPREALQEHAELARLSKELVTIREGSPGARSISTRCAFASPTTTRLRQLYRRARVPYARAGSIGDAGARRQPLRAAAPLGRARGDAPRPRAPTTRATSPSTRSRRSSDMIARARKAPYIAVDTETVIEPDSPHEGRSAALDARRDLDRGRSGRGVLPAAAPSRTSTGTQGDLLLEHRRPVADDSPETADSTRRRRGQARSSRRRSEAEDGRSDAPSRRASPRARSRAGAPP